MSVLADSCAVPLFKSPPSLVKSSKVIVSLIRV
jgi:hypothetical protein